MANTPHYIAIRESVDDPDHTEEWSTEQGAFSEAVDREWSSFTIYKSITYCEEKPRLPPWDYIKTPFSTEGKEPSV